MITRIVVVTALSLLSFSSYASKVDFNLYGGTAFAKLANNRLVQINDDVENYYQPSAHYKADLMFGAGIGHTFENIFQKSLNLSAGLSAYYIDLSKVKGVESPFINSGSYDQLNYQFGVISSAIMFEPRLIFTKSEWQPYLLLGIGVAWNHLHTYQEEPTNPNSSAAPAEFYGSHSQSAFAYEAGLGIQHAIYHDDKHKINYFAALDYRYMNLGEGRLSNFTAMTSNDHLVVTNIGVQAIVLTLGASV